MKLYHATNLENAEDIDIFGIEPRNTDDGRCLTVDKTLQGKGLIGVYGFTSEEDALAFACNQGWDYFVIFWFETDEIDGHKIIDDPEYDDGESKFVECEEEENVTAWICDGYEID